MQGHVPGGPQKLLERWRPQVRTLKTAFPESVLKPGIFVMLNNSYLQIFGLITPESVLLRDILITRFVGFFLLFVKLNCYSTSQKKKKEKP